jgi:signal peptidase complex subunit 1
MDMIKSITVHMDYVGRAVKLYQIIILLFGVVGLFWGYTIQQFSQTVYILGAGLVLASLLTIPPWGIFRYPTFISRLQNVNFPM